MFQLNFELYCVQRPTVKFYDKYIFGKVRVSAKDTNVKFLLVFIMLRTMSLNTIVRIWQTADNSLIHCSYCLQSTPIEFSWRSEANVFLILIFYQNTTTPSFLYLRHLHWHFVKFQPQYFSKQTYILSILLRGTLSHNDIWFTLGTTLGHFGHCEPFYSISHRFWK